MEKLGLLNLNIDFVDVNSEKAVTMLLKSAVAASQRIPVYFRKKINLGYLR